MMSIPEQQPTDKPGDATANDIAKAARDLADAVGNPAAEKAVLDLAAGFGNLSMTTVLPTMLSVFQSHTKSQAGEISTAVRAMLADEIGSVREHMVTQSEQLAEAIAAISTVDRRVDLSNSRAIDRWGQMQEHLDARFDNFGKEIDGVVTQIGGVKGAIDTLHVGFSEIGEKVDSIAFRQDEQAMLLAQVVANQSDMEARQTELERQVGINGGVIAELRENDKAKFKQLETLHKENKAQARRIDELTKAYVGMAEEMRAVREDAAVGVIPSTDRARLMRMFFENEDAFKRLLENETKRQQANG